MEEFVNLVKNSKITAKAKADIIGNHIKGRAEFTEHDVDGYKYVYLNLQLDGSVEILKPGKHAVHIHEKGDCHEESFKCAGGHFDPGNSGNTDPDANHGYHLGDLPNIIINKDGRGVLQAISTRFTLSNGPTSIIQPKEGTSIMIHANKDPYTPGDSGSGHSGGPRLACGIIHNVKM